MNQKDLKQIKEVIDESISVNNVQIKKLIDDSISSNNQVLRRELILDFGQFIEENINPQFEGINSRFDQIDIRFDAMERKDERDRGELTLIMRKEDKKVNKLSRILHKKKILTKTELKQLEEHKVFPN